MSNIKLFESKQIRTVWNEADQKWYFAVADVVKVLTDTPNPTDYIKKMCKRDEELSKGWGQFVTPLYMETAGGKQQLSVSLHRVVGQDRNWSALSAVEAALTRLLFGHCTNVGGIVASGKDDNS